MQCNVIDRKKQTGHDSIQYNKIKVKLTQNEKDVTI